MNNIKILIIEDDEDHAFLEEDILTEELDCTVQIVKSKGALTENHIHTAQVVLLDFNLPDANGIDVLQYIRSISDVPVLIITGNDQLNTAVETLKGGATDFLIKSPQSIQQLPQLVLNILAAHNQKAQDQVEKNKKKKHEIKVETIKQMLTTLAHYINNSTTTIYGYAQLCQQNPEDSRRCQKLSEVSIKETQKITFVLQELEAFVNATEIKTTNYVNIPEAMFEIEENLKRKMDG